MTIQSNGKPARKWFYTLLFLCLVVAGIFILGGRNFDEDAKQTVKELLARCDVKINGERPWDIQVNSDEFYERVLSQGSLGFGESFVDNLWDCKALDTCVCRIQREKLSSKVKPSFREILTWVKAKIWNLQDKIGSRKVIDQHYQLGNDLYQNMLDSLMVYSCGYWKNAKTLEEAQIAKFDLICRKLGFKPGMRVLDIGCGWGGFEKYAAENYGVHVTGVTLSENQAEFARAACKGLPVEIRLEDYRDLKGTFDRVIEIGMFEHVGVKNYREFMQKVHDLLEPHGLFMLHTIGNNISEMTTEPWIDTYIFPNGQLPSIAQIGNSTENLFVMEDWHNFGPDYDKTLCAWFANFSTNWPKLQPIYGDRFYRMWKYYLLGCAGSFRARECQLWQVVLSKGGVVEGYQTVR